MREEKKGEETQSILRGSGGRAGVYFPVGKFGKRGWGFFLLYRQSRYTYWYNDLYSMSAEAYVLQKVGEVFFCMREVAL